MEHKLGLRCALVARLTELSHAPSECSALLALDPQTWRKGVRCLLGGWQTGRSDHPLRCYRSLVRGMSLFGLPAPAVTSVMNPPQKDRACRNVIKGNENAFLVPSN